MSEVIPEVVIIGDTRYRYEDARRLGLLPTDGKVLTARSVNVASRTTNAPAGLAGVELDKNGNPVSKDGLLTSESAGGAPPATDTDQMPTRSGSKRDWTAYALAHGKTEAELDGLGRDQIAELFPTE